MKRERVCSFYCLFFFISCAANKLFLLLTRTQPIRVTSSIEPFSALSTRAYQDPAGESRSTMKPVLFLFLINCWSSVVASGCVATVCAISTTNCFFFFFFFFVSFFLKTLVVLVQARMRSTNFFSFFFLFFSLFFI